MRFKMEIDMRAISFPVLSIPNLGAFKTRAVYMLIAVTACPIPVPRQFYDTLRDLLRYPGLVADTDDVKR